MASRDSSNRTPKRIPETRIVGPNRFVKNPTGVADSISVSSNPFRASSITVNAVAGGPAELSEADVPELSDITVYTALVAKQRAVTKEIYYEIVFKVKNSSDTPDDIVGVDARIVGTEPEND